MTESLLKTSLENHQRLIDVIKSAQAEDGYCYISTIAMAEKTEHSITWVNKAIKRLNSEGLIIERSGKAVYKLHAKNITEKGVFKKLLEMFIEFEKNPDMILWQYKYLQAHFGVSYSTVCMFRAYVDDMVRNAQKEQKFVN